MQILKKDNKIYAYYVKDNLGDYVLNDQRYTINTAKEVYAPDNADLSIWNEVDSVEAFVSEFMVDFTYQPLTKEEKEAIMEAERKKIEEENSN